MMFCNSGRNILLILWVPTKPKYYPTMCRGYYQKYTIYIIKYKRMITFFVWNTMQLFIVATQACQRNHLYFFPYFASLNATQNLSSKILINLQSSCLTSYLVQVVLPLPILDYHSIIKPSSQSNLLKTSSNHNSGQGF